MRTRPAEIEQHSPRCGVVLSIAAMCSVSIDPTAPTLSRWLPLTGGPFMSGAHALAALGCHLLIGIPLR